MVTVLGVRSLHCVHSCPGLTSQCFSVSKDISYFYFSKLTIFYKYVLFFTDFIHFLFYFVIKYMRKFYFVPDLFGGK